MTSTTTTNPTAFSQQTGTASAAEPAVASNDANGMSDMFLKLLVAQIKNQNPLEPTDPSEFVTQLNALSQTEALQKLVSQNTDTLNALSSMQVLALGGQVGSTVSVESGTVRLSGEPVHGSFVLQDSSSAVTLVAKGVDGVAHRIALGAQQAGSTVDFSIDPAALGLPAGNYALSVETDPAQTPSIRVNGQLSGVRYAADGSLQLDVSSVGAVASSAITGFLGRPN